MTAVGPICFMVVALVALLWAAGVLPPSIALRVGVASGAVFLVNAAVQKAIVDFKQRRREREAVEQIRKLREATVASLLRNDYVLAVADGPITAGDLVQMKDGKVKKVERLSETVEGGIQ